MASNLVTRNKTRLLVSLFLCILVVIILFYLKVKRISQQNENDVLRKWSEEKQQVKSKPETVEIKQTKVVPYDEVLADIKNVFEKVFKDYDSITGPCLEDINKKEDMESGNYCGRFESIYQKAIVVSALDTFHILQMEDLVTVGNVVVKNALKSFEKPLVSSTCFEEIVKHMPLLLNMLGGLLSAYDWSLECNLLRASKSLNQYLDSHYLPLLNKQEFYQTLDTSYNFCESESLLPLSSLNMFSVEMAYLNHVLSPNNQVSVKIRNSNFLYFSKNNPIAFKHRSVHPNIISVSNQGQKFLKSDTIMDNQVFPYYWNMFMEIVFDGSYNSGNALLVEFKDALNEINEVFRFDFTLSSNSLTFLIQLDGPKGGRGLTWNVNSCKFGSMIALALKENLVTSKSKLKIFKDLAKKIVNTCMYFAENTIGLAPLSITFDSVVEDTMKINLARVAEKTEISHEICVAQADLIESVFLINEVYPDKKYVTFAQGIYQKIKRYCFKNRHVEKHKLQSAMDWFNINRFFKYTHALLVQNREMKTDLSTFTYASTGHKFKRAAKFSSDPAIFQCRKRIAHEEELLF